MNFLNSSTIITLKIEMKVNTKTAVASEKISNMLTAELLHLQCDNVYFTHSQARAHEQNNDTDNEQ